MPWVATRLLCFLWVHLAAEVAGLLALLGVWVMAGFGRRRAWMAEWTWRFQQVWAGWLFAAVRALFGLPKRCGPLLLARGCSTAWGVNVAHHGICAQFSDVRRSERCRFARRAAAPGECLTGSVCYQLSHRSRL